MACPAPGTTAEASTDHAVDEAFAESRANTQGSGDAALGARTKSQARDGAGNSADWAKRWALPVVSGATSERTAIVAAARALKTDTEAKGTLGPFQRPQTARQGLERNRTRDFRH